MRTPPRELASFLSRNVVAAALLCPALAFLPGCGGGGGSDEGEGGGGRGGNGAGGNGNGNGNGSGSGSGGSSVAPGPSPAGKWTLGQSLTKNWDSGAPSWDGGNSVSFGGVEAGATLVLAAYGYTYPTVAFPLPVDSAGQAIEVAVDTGGERSVQAVAWVLHGAAAGAHTWEGLPDLSTGDGKLFFAEFRHGGAASTKVIGAATQTDNTFEPPWLTSGSVTMSSGAGAGDLLVAFSLEEEAGVGNPDTGYTDPPEGWASLGVQNQSKINIAGEACWRVAPDDSPQTVRWSWSLAGEQDPSLFKAAVFAIHAP